MTIEVTLSRPPASTTFEVGSFAEAVAILQDNESALIQLFTLADGLSGAASAPETGGEGQPAAATEKPPRKPRTPKVEAVAPPPMPVPSAAPPAPPAPVAPPMPPAPLAPTLAIPADGGIPAFLDRTAAPPVSGPVTAKVVAELTKRATTAPDKGAALVAWMAHPATGGFVVPGASFDEAVAVLHQLGDAKVAGLLAPLGLQ